MIDINLIQGELVDDTRAVQLLPRLRDMLEETLAGPLLPASVVIRACEKLAASLPDELVISALTQLGMGERQAGERLAELRLMFGGEYLRQRLRAELGEDWGGEREYTPLGYDRAVTERIYPLGVLFHIAAGNMDGLPVYTVIEGLLAGNINLLKLPSVDGGLTLTLLRRLCELEPLLAGYIYVFDFSSGETESIKRLTELADAVVIWGGDDAVRAVRSMTPPNMRIIEWGHKLSFAYVTTAGITREGLEGLARHVCETNQLLCTSCQGIFLDTDSDGEAREFCRSLLEVLEDMSAQYPDVPLAAKAQNALRLRTRRLESVFGDAGEIFAGARANVILEPDSELTASLQYRSVWVRRLKRENIVSALRPYKNHLQTAALLCAPDELDTLRDLLWRAGVVRISAGEDMSRTYCGAAHDGEYTLRRYTKVVSVERGKN